MIKLIITLLLISHTSLAQDSMCNIDTYSQIIKINQVLDDKIIKKSNCSQDINDLFVSMISNANGHVHSNFLERLFKNEIKMNVKVSPSTVKISTLSELVEEKYADHNIVVDKVTSLYGKSSLNLTSSDQMSIDCNSCEKTGKKNVKININDQSFWMSISLLKRKFAFTTNISLSARTPLLSKSDFTEKMITARDQANVFTDIDNIQFYRLSRNLLDGDVLKLSDLTPKKLINYGQKVNVLYKNGSINLKTTSVAKKAGRFGDYIELENPKSKKQIIGKIIDFNTVVVEL